MGDGFGNLYDPEEGEPLRDLLGLHQSQKTTQQLKALREAQERDKAAERAKPQCPYCGGRLPGQFEICTHCRNPLSWVDGVPCKPGTETQTRTHLATARKALHIKQVQEAAAGRMKTKIAFGIWLGIPTLAAIVLFIVVLIFGKYPSFGDMLFSLSILWIVALLIMAPIVLWCRRQC